MYFIENSKLIECKNKALNNWSKHNFIFKKFSDLVIQKITELKKEFKNNFIDFDSIVYLEFEGIEISKTTIFGLPFRRYENS